MESKVPIKNKITLVLTFSLVALIPKWASAQQVKSNYLYVMFAGGFDNQRISLYLNNRLILRNKLIRVSPIYGISPMGLKIESTGNKIKVYLSDSTLSVVGNGVGVEFKIIDKNAIRAKSIYYKNGKYLYITTDGIGYQFKQQHRPMLLD